MSGSAAVERVVGHYRILERLGRGGMGVVYKAEDLQLGRTVALKFLGGDATRDEDSKQRFVNEARAASQLDHPNICTVHEIGEDEEGELFIVMSYYDGETLETRLEQGAMPPRAAVDVVLQVARGLARAHESGIIHRDIKPGNVIISRDGTAKIVDFGLAKLSGASLTQSGAALGTIDYMSPEQLQGIALTPATDVWSLGVLLFELLTGARPFRGESMGAVITSILRRDVPELRDVDPSAPPELNALLRKMLQSDVRERYESAAGLLPDLQAVAASMEDVSSPGDVSRLQTLVASGSKLNPRRKARILVAVVAVVFALASAAIVFIGTRRHPGTTALRDGRAMIAVLPFDNVGAAQDRFFADGVTEEIISRLAAVRELGVISRTSVYAYDRKGRSIRDIGKDLGVDYVLEGTVRWEKTASSNRVRVTPQLIRVSDDTHIWADRYERDLVEVFAVQSDIAEQVTRQLGIALGQSIAGGARTSNAEAYEEYLRAAPARWSYDEAEIRASIAQAQKAVAADARFAAAHALLAQLQMRMYHHFERSAARLDAARLSIDTSLSIEPGNPDARTALGYYYYWGSLDYGRAIDQWSAALRSRPGDSSALAGIAYAHRRRGKFTEAVKELQELQRLDPRNENVFAELAMTFSGLRKFDDAERVARQGLVVAPNDTLLAAIRFANLLAAGGSLARTRAILSAAPPLDEEMIVASWYSQELCERKFREAAARVGASSVTGFVTAPTAGMWGTVRYPRELLEARALQLSGDRERAKAKYEAACEVLEKERADNPGDARIHSALGLTYAGLGRKDDAIRETERAIEICPVSADAIDGPTRLAEAAQVYAQTGRDGEALDALERLLAMPAMFSVELVKVDPLWDPLRKNPRFATIVGMR